MACAFCTHCLSSGLARSLALELRSSGGELSTIQANSRRSTVSSSRNRTSLPWAKHVIPSAYIGAMWRHLLTAAAGEDQPRGETFWDRSTRGGGEGERVALRVRVHHKAKHWLIFTHCSNTSNTATRTAVLVEATTCGPALTPFIDKCYGERTFFVFSRMGSGERHKIDERHGSGVVLHTATASVEADPKRVRAKRC